MEKAWLSVSQDTHRERELDFVGAKPGEVRAATYLQILTHLRPRLEDTDGRQGAVDLTLERADGQFEIAEVTSTLDRNFLRDSNQLRHFERQLLDEYSGAASWALAFEYGWAMPATRAGIGQLSRDIASQLMVADTSAERANPVQVAPDVYAFVHTNARNLITIGSWNSNIPISLDQPYLNRLSTYLNESELVSSKLMKLEVESGRLNAQRSHLYLLMAGSGEDGGLLPVSPSYFTWGEFRCPPEVTDLWLDGGTGEIYHWSDLDGWKFHRT
ncbi:hypothetical protein [Frigoribacterium sp. CG_9.8]|uniref:hypothetical protein n=1 Tax=Frigoribacterium sp. CG_9.8 TaxID=2787733 RepID=UPI0018CA7777|nr:hypothetical protein [Frigoribacterium sp. CG_9.8]MBG6109065.1 hypothetical protein [Frigoribacterium sp. CG_9.8]